MSHQLHEDTINALIGEFLRQAKAGKVDFSIPMTHLNDWNVDLIHASDLGKCPRKMSHRIHHSPAVDKSMGEQDSELRQFYVANIIHNLVYNAFAWDDRLVEFEIDLTPWLPDGMTGTADGVWENFDGEYEAFDAKSLHPNWRSYLKSYPKADNVAQLSLYYYGLKKRSNVIDKQVARCRMYYVGRGDKTRGLECPFDPDPDLLRRQIDELVIARDSDPFDLPTIPKVIKKTGGDVRMTKIELVPDWNCEWCDFQGLSCVPHDMKKHALLYKVDKKWVVSRMGKEMSERILFETGVAIDNLGALDAVERQDSEW